MKTVRVALFWALVIATSTSCAREAAWRPLFDGRTTTGWRNFKSDSIGSGWQVIDSALTRAGPGAGDIITRDKFKNFELALEWKIAPGGNSGILYRASEDDDAVYWTAPEMQVLDDAHHPDGASRLTSAGANYGIDSSPPGFVNFPAFCMRLEKIWDRRMQSPCIQKESAAMSTTTRTPLSARIG